MLDEAAQTAQEITPFVLAAITAYGSAVLTRAEEHATDATLSFGRRLLRRLTRRDGEEDGDSGPAREDFIRAVIDAAGAPQSAEMASVVRTRIERLLHDAPALAAEIATWELPVAPATVAVTSSGERSPAVQYNFGTIHTGDTRP
ncbi:hypothetical protein [Streptomyces lancefieldiae]|uniref:Uncharacterized protein n=1 Tax=Streptomyces lancefieldiae TaxID=3075520 RepID=A0ABU3APK3_9ACTN|nr:hypothetical protein [Streptomyces sp. DSM 40712]MDT0612094.1 hypothetical protein [Streptomyces sp. DSM 40712]